MPRGASEHLQHACCAPPKPLRTREEESYDPAPNIRIPRKVIKGEFTCAPPTPALGPSRFPEIDTSTCHLGFRCVGGGGGGDDVTWSLLVAFAHHGDAHSNGGRGRRCIQRRRSVCKVWADCHHPGGNPRRAQGALARIGHVAAPRSGLELAADIIGSVVSPTPCEIGRLGAIAVIRTFLNYFLEKDLERCGCRDRTRHRRRSPARFEGRVTAALGVDRTVAPGEASVRLAQRQQRAAVESAVGRNGNLRDDLGVAVAGAVAGFDGYDVPSYSSRGRPSSPDP